MIAKKILSYFLCFIIIFAVLHQTLEAQSKSRKLWTATKFIAKKVLKKSIPIVNAVTTGIDIYRYGKKLFSSSRTNRSYSYTSSYSSGRSRRSYQTQVQNSRSGSAISQQKSLISSNNKQFQNLPKRTIHGGISVSAANKMAQCQKILNRNPNNKKAAQEKLKAYYSDW